MEKFIQTEMEQARINLAYFLFEKEKTVASAENDVRIAEQKVRDAKQSVTDARNKYIIAVAQAIPCLPDKLQLSNDSCRNKLISHHVYDLRSNWPCCIFCGSPRDGD